MLLVVQVRSDRFITFNFGKEEAAAIKTKTHNTHILPIAYVDRPDGNSEEEPNADPVGTTTTVD